MQPLGFKVAKSSGLLRKRSAKDSPVQQSSERSSVAKVSQTDKPRTGRKSEIHPPLISASHSTVKTKASSRRRATVSASSQSLHKITDFFPKLQDLPSLPSKFADVQPPAHVRHTGLLSSALDSLPERYLHLLRVFTGVETVVSFQRSRNAGMQLVFDRLKSAIETGAESSVSTADFARMVAVCPELFDVHPARVMDPESGCLKPSFRFDWPGTCSFDDSELKRRSMMFQSRLVDMCRGHYSEWQVNAKSSSSSDGVYDEAFMSCGPALPQSEQVLRAIVYTPPTTKDTVRQCLAMFKRPQVGGDDENKENARVDISKMPILERIRFKEARAKELAEKNKRKTTSKERAVISRLPKIASNIESCFYQKDKTALYQQELTHALILSMKSPISQAEVREACEHIAKIVPQWLKIDKNEFGAVITIQPEISRSEFMEAIEHFVNVESDVQDVQ